MKVAQFQRSSATTGPWAARVPAASAAAAAALRLQSGVYARHDDSTHPRHVWLRGGELTDTLDLELRKLPGAERFTIDSDDAGDVITPLGKRIPAGTLPSGGWMPIAAWCRTIMPPPALPGQSSKRVNLSLVRSDRPAETSVLVTTLASWTDWAINAPLVRLRRLAFAASADGRVVVRGSPLPPIAGIQYVEQRGVAVPAGLALRPAVDPATIHALLMMTEADLVLFSDDGGYDRIDADQFVAASRSAVRATSAIGQAAGNASDVAEPED